MSESVIASALDAAFAFVFPQGCHVCEAAVTRRGDGVACGRCWDQAHDTLLLTNRRICGRCGTPEAGACARCAPDALDAARSAALFSGAVRATLLDVKRRPRVAGRLADLLETTYRSFEVLHAADVAVPVPLHPARLAERGHNQAALLADVLGQRVGLVVEPAALARTELAERRRAGAGRAERAQTVRGAFHGAAGIVAGRTVLLVDDLYTTGATAGACAKALRDAGAAGVLVLTVGRVVNP